MKKYGKKSLLAIIFLAFALCLFSLSGCTADTPVVDDNDSANAEPQTRTVVDNDGNSVEVPAQIERVAIISTMPLASVYCMVRGSGEGIIALTPASANAAATSLLAEIAPELADVSTDFATGEVVNVEEVIKLHPDVVFYNTGNQADSEAVANLQTAGIPCVGFSTTLFEGNTIETFNAWVELLGDVFGEETGEQVEAIVEYGRAVEADVIERVSAIPEAERKSALILANYTSGAIVAAGNTFGRYWLRTIGAENVAMEIDKPISPVNLEQIYAWNPDVIFLNSFSAFKAEDILNNTAVEGHDWSGIQAVKDGNVYKFPMGVYYWFPPCSESPLALQWLAKTLYPELFEDIDMIQMIKDYYHDFYNFDLSQEQLDFMFNPPAETAMNY